MSGTCDPPVQGLYIRLDRIVCGSVAGSVDGTGNVTGYLFSPSSFYYTIWQKMQGIGV